MADFVEVKLEGLEPIIRKLRRLEGKVADRAMRRALRKGANVIRDKARTNTKRIDDPATRAKIYKNIGVASGGRRRERQAGGPMMRVGVRGGARYRRDGGGGLSGGNTTHWRFVEFGTSDTKAQPFMRPAMNQGAGEAIQAIIRAAPGELDKELIKLGII